MMTHEYETLTTLQKIKIRQVIALQQMTIVIAMKYVEAM